MEVSLSVRDKAWLSHRRKTMKRASSFFNMYLSQKACSGYLDFNYEQETLTLKVQATTKKRSVTVVEAG